jgi:hypothetical protein
MSEQGHKGGGPITSSMSEREKVERTADRIRDELLLTIEELDRRRERAMDVKYQVRHFLEQNRDMLGWVAGGAVALVGLSVGLSLWRSRHHEELMMRRRRVALRRAWEHPERLATGKKQQPFALEMGQRLVLIFGTALATSLAKSAVQSLMPPKQEKQDKRRLGPMQGLARA